MMMKILAVPGSIRKDSYNRKVCNYLRTLSNAEVTVTVSTIEKIPFFSEDLEKNIPEEVTQFIEKVRDADAIVISTPEYNNMIPGVLKNVCEWLTRSYSSDAVRNKPLGIIGASTGGFGTVRAQSQLMLLGVIMGFSVRSNLKLPIANAQKIFDEKGNLTDQEVKTKVDNFFDSLLKTLR